MPISVSVELTEEEIKHFRLIMQEARKALASIPADDIIEASEQLLESSLARKSSAFVKSRLVRLRVLIDMLQDKEWDLPNDDAKRVLNALAYFAEPEDLIPDHIPGIGMLDDAIMVELVCQELATEINAYEEFNEFRKTRPANSPDNRQAWLQQKRKELHKRIKANRRK